jgi:hypothetical protein
MLKDRDVQGYSGCKLRKRAELGAMLPAESSQTREDWLVGCVAQWTLCEFRGNAVAVAAILYLLVPWITLSTIMVLQCAMRLRKIDRKLWIVQDQMCYISEQFPADRIHCAREQFDRRLLSE